MAYSKTQWVNDGPPAISADNLNNIENGIYSNTVKLDSITDYIEEEGTSGIWTYRKWHSGIAECWGNATEQTTFSQWGSIYSCELSAENFPTGLFIETPACMASFGNGGASAISSARGLPSASQTFQGAAVRGSAAGGTYTWTKSYYALGRWK